MKKEVIFLRLDGDGAWGEGDGIRKDGASWFGGMRERDMMKFGLYVGFWREDDFCDMDAGAQDLRDEPEEVHEELWSDGGDVSRGKSLCLGDKECGQCGGSDTERDKKGFDGSRECEPECEECKESE